MNWSGRRLHMIGIGGAGMSALATVAYAWGADVSGCDRAASPYSDRLARFGDERDLGKHGTAGFVLEGDTLELDASLNTG